MSNTSPVGGINMDALKERLAALKKTNKNSNLTWRPTDKEQTIRIVPYKYQPDNPFIELYFHYNLNGKSYLSPVSYGKPDPIMEVAQELKSAGDKESWKQGKQLEPKLRTFAAVVIRGKESEGVKFWGFGKTIYEELLSNMADPECGNITDPALGRDIVVYNVKEEGKNFATPKMRIKMATSPVTTDRDILTLITKEQPDIKELYELKSYEELQKALYDFLHPEEGDESDDSSEQVSETVVEAKKDSANTNGTATETATPPTPEKAATDSVDISAAFSTLFDKQ